MKIIIVFVVIFFLGSCTNSGTIVSPTTEPPPIVHSQEDVEPKLQKYFTENSTFDRVVGWISETSLIMIERDKDEFLVYAYDVYTADKTLITTVNKPIIQVNIHPSKGHLAIIMSDNSLQATIQIVTIDGKAIDELTIESSEVYLDWNTTNVNLLLITAFNKDWTFDTFVYSSLTQEMTIIPTLHPILKWASEDKLVAINWMAEDALLGGRMMEISTQTSEVNETEDSGYIYFDMYKDYLVSVKIDSENEEFVYTLSNVITNDTKVYRSPALSNYSQWYVPELVWTENHSFLTYIATKPGLIDSFDGEFLLTEFNLDSKKVKNADFSYSTLQCTPSGDRCLSGTLYEEIWDLVTGDVFNWLEIKE